MREAVTYIFLFSLLALFVCPACIDSGGVHWEYHLFSAAVPLASFLAARHIRKLSFLVCYGLAFGWWLSTPVFITRDMRAALMYDETTVEVLFAKQLAYILAFGVACAAAAYARIILLPIEEDVLESIGKPRSPCD